MNSTLRGLTIAGVSVMIAACAGSRPAPIEERPIPSSAGAVPSAQAPATTVAPAPAARAGFHTVAKGETLYSIALENGQDWRDLVVWNKLENPNLIRIGQEIRVLPPEGSVETRPILTTSPVQARPLDTAPPAGTAAATGNTPTFKREPRGGVEAYSEETFAAMKSPATPAPAVNPAGLSAAEPTAAPGATAAAPAAAVASAPDAVRSEEGIEWSWPANGRIIGRFGEGANKGVDIAGKQGEPVLAAAGGRVVYAGEAMRGYGKLVIIKHDNTYLSAYAHNSRILVQERDTVKRGQRIADLGDTDTETGKPRLHFEVRRQGKPVDPLKYLPPR
ncbi:peptidoglycan DD-metalloendopeptidase family protein [Methyloversatilis thermotolerans]|uniref:peptidoglycan DD-metalloendopeptidase family protein n=1 Tax=Methyloversatilis thermotolerans TaxID=1346290 RepID=UPI00037AB5CC|nr:peptidoglycan DD-metalloendopeptidase family protein [Methyloversatilis thermotolerans]